MMLWVVAHVFEFTNISPWNIFSFYLGAFLLFSGIALWTIWYKRTRGYFPNPIEKYYDERQKNWGPFAGVKVLQKYFYEWATVWFAAWMIMAIAMSTQFKNSEAFTYTRYFVEQDIKTQVYTGGVVGYGFYAGGSMTTGSENSADLTFRIIGKVQSTRASMKLHKEGETWIIDSYNFY
jgi:hypothetical protein